MSAQIASTAFTSSSQKKLKGVYWKSFLRFVNKDSQALPRSIQHEERQCVQSRRRSFEYMELTAQDHSPLPSESSKPNCSSASSSSTETLKDDKISIYAILDMSNGKEITLNEDVSIIEEPTRSHPNSLLSSSPPFAVAVSPKCSPILNDGVKESEVLTPSPSQAKSEGESGTRHEEKSKPSPTEKEENSFDLLESKSPSMEPAPWRDQMLSIQMWMVPPDSSGDENRILIHPPFTESDHCHYVPTLEAIIEESEDSAEGRSLMISRISKSASFSDDTEIQVAVDRPTITRSNSASELRDISKQSVEEDDLYSITSTFGSLNSMRRIPMMDNLSMDETEPDCDVDLDSAGSSDELDRIECNVNGNRTTDSCNDVTRKLSFHSESTKPEFSQEFEELPADVHSRSPIKKVIDVTDSVDDQAKCAFVDFDDQVEEIRIEIDDKNHTVTSQYSDNRKSRSSTDSAAQSVENYDFLSSGRSSPIIESAPEFYENRFDTRSNSPESYRRDSGVTISDVDIPGLPKELYFDSKDIPKIVVMFAQEEIAKEKLAKQSIAEAPDETPADYRKRSLTLDLENSPDSAYSSREGVVQRRIHQLKAAETCRLSTLSTSTPELTAVNADCLLYIPVSYASEAAAKKKNKRRATMSNAEASRRRANFTKALQTKALISGTGLGNGFNSLRKRLTSRKSTPSTLRRSQSEKPQLSHSNPDVSSSMARFLNSPRRRAHSKTQECLKDDGKRKGIKKAVSDIFRRLSSKFSAQNRPNNPSRIDKPVVDDKSPTSSYSLDALREEPNSRELVLTDDSREGSPATAPSTIKRTAAPPLSSFSTRLDLDCYRQRSYSVPTRPHSQQSSMKYASTESDVFESLQSVDSDSLRKNSYA